MISSSRTIAAIARHMREEEGSTDQQIAEYLKITEQELGEIVSKNPSLPAQRKAQMPKKSVTEEVPTQKPKRIHTAYERKLTLTAPGWRDSVMSRAHNGSSMAGRKLDADLVSKRAKPVKGRKKCPTSGCDNMIPKSDECCQVCWSRELVGRPPVESSLQYFGGDTKT